MLSGKAVGSDHGRYGDLVAVLTKLYPSPEHSTYITGRWNDRVLKAEWVAKKNKKRYYVLRIGFISLATLVPPVVTAQAAVDGDVRALLGGAGIVLSSLVAVSAALLEITKPGQRWRLYQRLRYDLESVGWDLAENRQPLGLPTAIDDRFMQFVERTEQLLRQYADDYFSQIAQIASIDRDQRAGSVDALPDMFPSGGRPRL